MRSFLKWTFRALLLLIVIAVAAGLWKREEITRLMAVNSLFSEEKIVDNFSHMDRAFLTTEVPRGNGPTSPLPYGPDAALPPGTDDWVEERSLTSLLVLKDGEIVHESYYQGTSAEDRRISWSVAKSFLSALVGVLLDDGTIESIDDPVTKYASLLQGGAYDGASLRQVLNMASGVTFDEDYLDFNSDINRMGRVLALGGRMDDFAAHLTETFAEPGETWKYVSIDTHVIGMVVRGAAGKPVADLLSEHIIQPLGLEYAPYYVTDGVGTAFVLGGLNLTTRDYARFGQMYAQRGAWQGRQIVPADWVDASTEPSAPGGAGYGYQWWIPDGSAPGEYMARGIYGQYIYIDTARQVVIVTTAADRQFRAPGANDQNVDMFRAIARNL
ncbi:6-aminohexanoate hydrolase [Sulfitobacter alexandrii]|uniref:6-aminohexanoate hydrolase n=1 Tax=Sulfitobacter alexandrii TaxID=1917485 RepID=A0A1J0WJ09_9RHOB|nr:serine hydrolase [Sulfitobacter alexandrii]APE44291.1 6-aminohexanoate hydrolase [Sulfitobacter alexandrii]